MDFFQSHWVLTLLIFVPLIGAGVTLLAPVQRAKHVALVTGIIEFLIAAPLFWAFQPIGTCRMGDALIPYQNCVAVPWIDAWGIYYRLGLDGISLFMVLLTAVLLPLTALGSFSYIKTREKSYYALLLALTTGVMGVFVSLDLFLFYIFWEMTLIPMYFLIGVWGGKERIYATIKFFLFTTSGSLLMLVGILYLYFRNVSATGVASFSYIDFLGVPLTGTEQWWLFVAFALAFIIKIPVFPFHTWLPAAHVQAPAAGSVVLAGLLLKMGTYGLLRFALPLFPQAAVASGTVTLFLVLGVIGILYAALVAAIQPSAKKLVAYTSVAHLGFAVLGIFTFNLQGVQGAMILMIAHGVSTPMLFFLLGMLYERRHTYELDEFGGLASTLPVFACMLVFAALATIGLPGTSGFMAEFLVLIGTFQVHPWIALFAATGVIVAAFYMLPMVQKVVFNALRKPANTGIPDLNWREIWTLAPLVIIILWIGIYPKPMLDRMEPAVSRLVEYMNANEAVASAPAPEGLRMAVAQSQAPAPR